MIQDIHGNDFQAPNTLQLTDAEQYLAEKLMNGQEDSFTDDEKLQFDELEKRAKEAWRTEIGGSMMNSIKSSIPTDKPQEYYDGLFDMVRKVIEIMNLAPQYSSYLLTGFMIVLEDDFQNQVRDSDIKKLNGEQNDI